jgi:hypothetical protein
VIRLKYKQFGLIQPHFYLALAMQTINEEERRMKQEQEVIVVTLASKTELV